MPRSGWLAFGSVLAAFAATQPWAGQAWLAQPAAWLLLAGSWLAILVRWRARGNPTGAPRSRLLPLVIVLAGALLIGTRLTIAPLPAATGPATLPSGAGPWEVSVEAIGNPRDGKQVATVALPVGDEAPLRIAITAPPDPAIGIGDVLRLSGRLQSLPTDDYGAYLAQSGVAATLASRTLEIAGNDPSLGSFVDRARRTSADGLALALPEPEAGLASGILIGLRDRVDRDLAKAFTAAGVSHVVAISGWNIAIVAVLVGSALRNWPRRRRSVATLALIALYTVLTGASASVVRAALMTATVTLARESGRKGSAAAALGWAAVVMLVVDPETVGDAGFQLSSLATAGLIAWATPLTERLKAWRGGVLPGWLAESLGVSFAAEAATLPVVLLSFGRLALLAPLVNLFVVPIVPPAMATGTIALVAGLGAEAGLPRELAALVGLPAWATLAVMIGIVQTAAALPFASVTLAPPFNLLSAALVAAIVGAVALAPAREALARRLRPLAALVRRVTPSRLPGPTAMPSGPALPRRLTAGANAHLHVGLPPDRRMRYLALGLAASVIGLVLIGAYRPDGHIRIDVLDVGQGDAILVQGDRGGRMLIDGGPDPGRLLVALDGRLPPWDRRIDLLVLTHPHEDHVAGMARLLDRYRVGRILQPGMLGPGPGYAALASWLLRHDRTAEELHTGDRIGLDSIVFRVLWPDAGAVPQRPPDTGSGINNVSIVLLGEVAGHRFLLMGDIEQDIDPILLARGVPRVEVLKVAHHGSRTASSEAFLDAARPAIAVASAGARNTYGHPAPQTLARLRARGAAVFRTDLDGTVEITLDGDRWHVRADHLSPSRPPSSAAAATLSIFRCAVPDPILAATDSQARKSAPDAPTGGSSDLLLFDRPDVRARPTGGGPPAPEPATPALAPPPLSGGRGDRRLARRANRGQRNSPHPRDVGPGASRARRWSTCRLSS